jgi:hypothetical protein
LQLGMSWWSIAVQAHFPPRLPFCQTHANTANVTNLRGAAPSISLSSQLDLVRILGQ